MYWYNFTAKPKKREASEREGGGRGGAENLSWPSDELTRDFA